MQMLLSKLHGLTITSEFVFISIISTNTNALTIVAVLRVVLLLQLRLSVSEQLVVQLVDRSTMVSNTFQA